MADLSRIVKAYDVRGVVPDEFDAPTARALGLAFARFVGADTVVVGRDMRPSGPAFVDAFSDGVQDAGVNVIDLGLVSTDLLYFASGSLDLPGAVFTASHNPAQYNGVKFCRSGARPVGIDSGLAEIRDVAQAILDGDAPSPAEVRGTRESRDMLDAFIDHVLSFVEVSALKPMRVVADTANGMGGLVVPALFDRLPMIELEVMYGELDGTFPNHPADPLQPANQRDLRARVVAGGFDIGLAFDGDADRVFIVDETGAGLSGSVTTAILAVAMLRDNPGSTILHNLICSKAVPETISAHGGNPIRTRVGHSFIKTEMAETNAVFGGEHSAHYYFADNFRADSGLIASLVMISELARSGSTLSKMRMPFEPYVASGEINTTVDDPTAVIDRVREMYRNAVVDELDGLTVDAGDWWFNLRPSNTEPLLRLNLEAQDSASCDEHVAEVLSIITS
ncbi:MAG: phosphomannomutase/phosphoglucomutase [Actinobacteria bacterium]|nr:phosphomannomutase/phosphoglucomutase [Actinomycetota bacterium]